MDEEQQRPREEETRNPAAIMPVIHSRNRRGIGDRPAALHGRGVNALLFRAFKWSVYGLLALNLGLPSVLVSRSSTPSSTSQPSESSPSTRVS